MPLRKKKAAKKINDPFKESARKALLEDPIMPEIIPPPRLPFETLVGLLADNPMSDKDIDGIRVTSYASKMLTAQEIRDLHFVFNLFDINKDGYINEAEFLKTFKCLGISCSVEQARRVFIRAAKASHHEHIRNERYQNNQIKNTPNEAAQKNSDSETEQESVSPTDVVSESSKEKKHVFKGLNFNQFLDVVISRQGESYDYLEELSMAFKYFDIHNSGLLTVDSLGALAKSVGYELSVKSCQEMVSMADRDGDGYINKSEFIMLMLKTNLYSSHLLG